MTVGHLLTTLECTILVELTRSGVENGLDRTDADGEDFWCNEDAAAAVNPRDDRMEEKGKRRKAKENNLTVLKRRRGEGEKRKGSGREGGRLGLLTDGKEGQWGMGVVVVVGSS